MVEKEQPGSTKRLILGLIIIAFLCPSAYAGNMDKIRAKTISGVGISGVHYRTVKMDKEQGKALKKIKQKDKKVKETK